MMTKMDKVSAYPREALEEINRKYAGELQRREEQVKHYLTRLDTLNRELGDTQRKAALMTLWAAAATCAALGLIMWRLM